MCPLNGHARTPSPLAGEGWGEGAFAEALSRIWYDCSRAVCLAGPPGEVLPSLVASFRSDPKVRVPGSR